MSPLRKLVAVTALALTSCAVAAGPAAAVDPDDDRIRLFKVTAEGSGTHARAQLFVSLPQAPSELFTSTSFAWKTTLPAIGFLPNGEAFVSGDTKTVHGTVTTNATHETLLRGLDGEGNVITERGFCEAKDAKRTPEGVYVKTQPETGQADAGAHLVIRPFDHFNVTANCTRNIYGGSSQLGVGAAPGALDQHFYLPAEATRQGKIIQLVQASPAQKNNCAFADYTTSCTLAWRGTITFEFTGYGDLGPEDIPEVPPAPPTGGGSNPPPPSGPPAPPAPIDEDLVVPIVKPGKLSRRGDTASVEVGCATACRGTVSAYAAGGTRASAARKPLAKAKFRAAAGKPTTVTVRFRGAALRKVRKSRSVRLVIDTGSAKKSVVVRAR